MFRTIRSFMALGLLACASTLAAETPPATPLVAPLVVDWDVKSAAKKPAPGSLEDMLDKALRNNPDIKAAEAKVREAEAEANRVRHQIVAKIVALRNEADLATKMYYHVRNVQTILEEKVKAGTASKDDLLLGMANVEKQQAVVIKLEADLNALLGTHPQLKALTLYREYLYNSTLTGQLESWADSTGRYTAAAEVMKLISVQKPMAERIKAALNKNVAIEGIKEELPLEEVLKRFSAAAGIDVPFRVLGGGNLKLSLMKGDLPVGAWLQAIEDTVIDVRFVVRDYGILVTMKNRIPDGAITVEDFWKRTETPIKTPAAKSEPKGTTPK